MVIFSNAFMLLELKKYFLFCLQLAVASEFWETRILGTSQNVLPKSLLSLS
jgi:hypothetical protein